MTEQDKVLLVLGKWVREGDRKWQFEPELTGGNGYIQLYSGMSYDLLRTKVREKLQLHANNITVKLGYQYPEWMAIDDGDGSCRQFITDDDEVELFVQMRRKIEEVNLCVTVTLTSNGISAQLPITKKLDPPLTQPDREEADTSEDDTLEDEDSENDQAWHDFAMSETPLTLPPSLADQPVGAGVECVTPVCTLPASPTSCGITIRDNEDIIRLRSPECPRRDKGKHILIPPQRELDDDSDEEEAQVVPDLNHIDNEIGESSRRVQRELFLAPPQPEAANVIEATTGQSDRPSRQSERASQADESDVGSLIRWDRFQKSLHAMVTTTPTDPALFGRDAPPVFNNVGIEGVDSALSDVTYEGDSLFVGRVYKSKVDCKIKIAIHAIHRKFHFRTTRSCTKFMVLNCVSQTCKWRVYAVLLDASGNFQIRQATLQHTCTVDERRNYHKLATSQVIGEIMVSRFVGIKRGPNPAAIRKMLLDEYHVNVSYWKAWRAREIAMGRALGSMAGSYALLPTYLAQVQNSNPGSICALEHVEDPMWGTRFKYCFIAFGASVHGYQFMRKVIIIDGTSLKGKYGGCLLTACAQAGNFQIFPLAIGIVDSENDDAWSWFFEKLSIFVNDSPDVVFISDRHSSIYSGLRRVYPMVHHAACIVHLWWNVKSQFKKKRIASLMSFAARAYTFTEFNKKFLQLQSVSPGCAAYLVDIGFEHWSRAHFQGKRYNIMDTNIAESWNAVLKEAREFPLICMLEYIRTTLMGWFAIRRDKALRYRGTLTPNVRKMVENNYDLSTSMAVREIAELEYQVQEQNGESYTVKLGAFTCSCMEFQKLGIPCPHAIAAAARFGLPTDVYVEDGYYVETWKRGFELKIYPVPSV